MRSPTRSVRPSKPRNGLHSRPPLERMMRLHEKLKAGKFPNCRKLAAELEVSAKTIQRDIEFMRDRLNLPIEYDQLNFGFAYTEPVTSFPSIEVSEGEMVALFVAQKAMEQYEGTPYEKALRTAFAKITQGLREVVEFQWGGVDSSISFHGLGRSVADLELFEAVSRAVLDSHEIEFEYQKLGSARHEARRIQPYHLGCVENQWYLFGLDLARRQLRTFALPRMRRARNTKVKFRRPSNFSIANFLSDSFGVFTGKARARVSLRFDEFASRLVSERRWHASQKMKTLGNGTLELTLDVGGFEEIERWILSWGEHATVLSPPALIERIRKIAGELHARYAK